MTFSSAKRKALRYYTGLSFRSTSILVFSPNTDANTRSSGFYSANRILELIAISHWFVQTQMPLSPAPPAGKRIPSALTVSREIFSGQEPANG